MRPGADVLVEDVAGVLNGNIPPHLDICSPPATLNHVALAFPQPDRQLRGTLLHSIVNIEEPVLGFLLTKSLSAKRGPNRQHPEPPALHQIMFLKGTDDYSRDISLHCCGCYDNVSLPRP